MLRRRPHDALGLAGAELDWFHPPAAGDDLSDKRHRTGPNKEEANRIRPRDKLGQREAVVRFLFWLPIDVPRIVRKQRKLPLIGLLLAGL